jgi:Tn3 transposase DDE domain
VLQIKIIDADAHQFPDTHRCIKQQLQEDLVLDNTASLDGLEEPFECRVRQQMGQFVFANRARNSLELRHEIQEALNVIEHWNNVNDFIRFGKGGDFATNQRDEQEISMLALHLVQICMVYINTLMIQRVLDGQAWMSRLTKEDRRGLTPLLFGHVNPYGSFRLDMSTRLPLDPVRIGPQQAGHQLNLYDESVG